MKKLILLFFTLPHWISAHAQMIPYKDMAVQIIESIAGNHYAPIAIDDNFSEKLFKNFINTLDSRRLYFTAEDYARLSNYMYSLDDELKSKPWKFLPEISILYKTRLQESEKICADLLNKTFKLNSTDTYEHPDTDTMLFFPASLLKKHWEKWLRYQVLHIMFGPHTAINDDSMKSDKELIALENEIKQKVLKLEQRYIKRITEHRSGYEEYIANVFFNTLAAMYDPHTSFFSKNSYEQFKDMLSSEIYSFGIALEEDDYGNVYVVKVTPGGAAWKSSLIHINDVIKGLRWEGNEYIDMSNAGKQDIEYIMNLSNEGKLEFTLRKINGTEYSVWLQKEKIDNEENIVKSYVLSGEKKIGYISLPGFYTEWDNYNGNGCANDVAKEIVKLKEENIEGLIIRPSQ